MQKLRGFTLIELIIVTIILGILAAALIPVIFSGLRAYDDVQNNVLVLDKLRYATERLAREIREVTYDPPAPSGGGTGFAFAIRGSSMVAFTRTHNGPAGSLVAKIVSVCNDGSAVSLNYQESSETASCTGAQVLTDELGGIGNLVFSYYQSNGSDPAADNTDVRSVAISLTLNHNGNDYTQRTRVELKNYSGP